MERRQLAIDRFAVPGIGLSALAAAVVFVAVDPGDQSSAAAGTILASTGVAMFVIAILGGLFAALAARRRWVRWLFRSGCIAPIAIAVLQAGFGPFALPEPLAQVLAAAGMLLVFGGFAFWLARWAHARRLRPGFAVIESDLVEATVSVFRSSTAQDDPLPASIEVLPRSQFAYLSDGQPIREWTTVEIHTSAPAPEDADDAWPTGDAAGFQRDDASHVYRERRLEAGEIDELRAIRRGVLRRGLLLALLHGWGTAALVQLLDGLWHWRLPRGVPRIGWILVALVMGYRIVRELVLAHALARDQRGGRVLRAWSRLDSTIADAPDTEFLPHSLLVWNERGEPSRWRADR